MPHYDASLPEMTLPLALLRTAGRMGGKTPKLEDQNREPIGYDRLILGAQVLGRDVLADPLGVKSVISASWSLKKPPRNTLKSTLA